MAKHTWDRKAGERTSVDDLYLKILSAKDIEGITILGGEPLEQAPALLLLLKKIKETPLSIILFTGYQLKQVVDEVQKQVMGLCDVVIDGPYIKDETDFSRPLIGSKNQQVHLISERYTLSELLSSRNKVEIRVSNEGGVKINGMLQDSLLAILQKEFSSI